MCRRLSRLVVLIVERASVHEGVAKQLNRNAVFFHLVRIDVFLHEPLHPFRLVTLLVGAEHAKRHDIDLTHTRHQVAEGGMTKIMHTTVEKFSYGDDFPAQCGGVLWDLLAISSNFIWLCARLL